MQALLDHINRIQDKLTDLQKQQAQEKKELDRVQQTLQLYQEKDRLQQGRIDELERQLEVVRATRPSTMNEADRLALEKRINQYLKEIEQCIALLNE